ncbi:MFS transporter [Marisediminicola sp. LYQ134]|uniref:MFS transporter n=1 Tax=Marisediminicola sp. LYQ134 TaxID=3391061 RepID=UPI003983242C
MTSQPPHDRQPGAEIRRARVAVALLFLTNGALFANFLPRYPEVMRNLDLTNTAFGLAVAAFPLGALVAGLSAGYLVGRFRSSRVAVASTLVTAVGILLAGSGSAWITLALGMALAGAMDSITDVAQNSHGLRVQRLFRRSILNSFHAIWSVGAVLGGVLGAGAAQVGIPIPLHLAISGVIFGGIAVVAYRFLLPGPEPADVATEAPATAASDSPSATSPAATSPAATPRRRAGMLKYAILAALVVIASAGAIVEDSGASWSAIYLSGSLGASAFVAGIGFVALQGMQFVGRIFGDRLVDRFGQRAVARTGGVTVLVGMGLALGFPSTVGTIVGFGLAGLGVATLIPAAMQAADELDGFRPGTALTLVSWLLRVGFLISPPIVGAIADAGSLRLGLMIVPLVGLLVVIFARVLPPSDAVAERRRGKLT